MAKALIGGKEHILAPFKFEALDLAGASIDRLIETSKQWAKEAAAAAEAGVTTVERTVSQLTSATKPLLHVVSVGVWLNMRNEAEAAGVKFEDDAERGIAAVMAGLRREATLDDIRGLQATFGQIMAEAGLAKSGETKGAQTEQPAPSENSSEA